VLVVLVVPSVASLPHSLAIQVQMAIQALLSRSIIWCICMRVEAVVAHPTVLVAREEALVVP
jgi:hypothetical protein